MTSLLLVKLRRDLRGNGPRIALMILAISISLIAFGAILYMRTVVDREISRAYLSTNPASATVLLDRAVDIDQIAAIAAEASARPRIIDATARTQFTAQMQGRPNPLQVFVAPSNDPMRMANFEVEQGTWPPAAGEIMIERDAMGLLDLAVGDTVVVKTPNGEPAPLRVAGVVHNPALAPAFQEQKAYGFLSTASLPLLGEQPVLDELKIQVADQPGQITPSRDRDRIAATGRSLGGWLEQTHGAGVQEIQVPTPYEHPHQSLMNTILLALLAFGGMSLVLSAILVATMLDGLLTRQIPQIGMLKAIGARSGRILQLYLLMTLFVAVAATAIAFAPAIALSRAWVPLLLDAMLNMDTASLTVPLWTYAAVVAAGLVPPLLIALVPLVRASRTTIREAIDYHGVDHQRTTATRLNAWLGRVRGLDRTLLIGIRNIFRRRARLLLSVGLLTTAGTLFIAGLSTATSLQALPEQAKAQRGWDVDVQLSGLASATKVTDLVAQLPHVTDVEAWTRMQTSVAEPGRISVTRTYPDQGHGSVNVAALPPASSLLRPSTPVEGRWLRPGDTDAIVLNQFAREFAVPDVRVGDKVQLSLGGRAATWQVVGIVEEVFVGSGAYVSTEGFAQATNQPNQTNLLRIATDRHDATTRTAVANASQSVLTDASITVKSAQPVDRIEAISTGHLLPVIGVALGIAVVMLVVGWIGLTSTMSANVLERTREFGVMHAIGAHAHVVRRIVLSEGVFVAAVSCVVAIMPALALTAAMDVALGTLAFYTPLPFRMSITGILVWVVVAVLGAAVATLAPASRASQLTVREALAHL